MWQLYRSANKRLPRMPPGVIIAHDSVRPLPAKYASRRCWEPPVYPGGFRGYRTLGSAMAFRAIMRAVWERSKAAPRYGDCQAPLMILSEPLCLCAPGRRS